MGGEEKSPEAVKKCIKSIRDNIDSNKYKLHVITLADCQQYVTFSNIIIDKVNSGKIPLDIWHRDYQWNFCTDTEACG